MPEGVPIILGGNHGDPVAEQLLIDSLPEWKAQGYVLCVEQRCNPEKLISMMNDKILEIEVYKACIEKKIISPETVPFKVKIRMSLIDGYYKSRELYLQCQQLDMPIHCVDIDFGLEACQDINELCMLVLEKENERNEAMASYLFKLYCQGERVILITGANHMINISRKLEEKIKSLRCSEEYLPKAYALYSSTKISHKNMMDYHQDDPTLKLFNIVRPAIQHNQVVVLSDQQARESFARHLISDVNAQELKDCVELSLGESSYVTWVLNNKYGVQFKPLKRPNFLVDAFYPAVRGNEKIAAVIEASLKKNHIPVSYQFFQSRQQLVVHGLNRARVASKICDDTSIQKCAP